MRQSRLKFHQLRFYAVDHLQCVLALTHDDDAGDHVAFPIPIGNAAPQVGAKHHAANVANPHRRTARAGHEHNTFDIGRGFCVTAAAHHVLRAAEFKQPPAGIVIAAAHRLHHFHNRNIARAQLVGIDVHLVLTHESAE